MSAEGSTDDMEKLIEAAFEHAKHLRECVLGANDYGARVAEAAAHCGGTDSVVLCEQLL